jgi:hypothetical protein
MKTITVKQLIEELKGLPPRSRIIDYDIRVINVRTGAATHLFNVGVRDEEPQAAQENNSRKIGF